MKVKKENEIRFEKEKDYKRGELKINFWFSHTPDVLHYSKSMRAAYLISSTGYIYFLINNECLILNWRNYEIREILGILKGKY